MLRPLPHRGDVVAAGPVAQAALVALRPSRPLPPAPVRGDTAGVFEIRDER